eukprot:315944-Pyramimonas_sp.AAC.1
MANAARKGLSAEEFIQELERKVGNYDANGKGIDQLFMDVNQMTIDSVQTYYGQQQQKPEEYQILRDQRMELPRKRRDIREQLMREEDNLLISINDPNKLDTAKVDYMPVPREEHECTTIGPSYDNPYESQSEPEAEPDPRRVRLDNIETEFKRIAETCATWRKLEYQGKTGARAEELYEAWECRDRARVGRLETDCGRKIRTEEARLLGD